MTDGVFGFAITFLVVNLVVPAQCEGAHDEVCLVNTLAGDGTHFLAYLISFFVIGIWWVVHHGLFRYFARYDAALLWANLVFLLTIAITPFILGLFADFYGTEVAVVLFSLVQASAGGMLLVVWQLGRAARLLRPEVTPEVFRVHRFWLAVAAGILVASAGVATVSIYAAHFVWVVLFAVIAYSQLSAGRSPTPGPKANPPGEAT